MIVWVASFLMAFLNYYVVYRWILRVPFHRNAKLSVAVIGGSCLLVLAMYLTGEFAFKGPGITIVTILALIILVKEKRITALLLSPMVFLSRARSTFWAVIL